MNKFIPVNEPLLNGNEKKYLTECIDTGWISSGGPFVKKFEKEFSKKVNRKFGIAVCNGSSALDVALAAIKIEKGDEVIMPTFTIISCAASIVRIGAVPVLIDCDEKLWNMNIDQIENRITKKTKAIMIVHIYGLPVDIDPVLKIADKYNLKIIEDAAEMIGQTYKGKPCGSFGDISIFSFYPNKHITTGEGGMVVTDEPVLADRCRLLRNLFFDKERRFIHEELGWNFRMTNLQAALGIAQLEKLDDSIARKRHIGLLYTELLSGISDIQLPIKNTEYADNIYWVYGIVLKSNVLFNATETIKRLKRNNIGCRHFFWPMHIQPVFQKMGLFKNESYPVAERLAKRGFYIPSGLALIDEQIKRVSDTIKEILR